MVLPFAASKCFIQRLAISRCYCCSAHQRSVISQFHLSTQAQYLTPAGSSESLHSVLAFEDFLTECRKLRRVACGGLCNQCSYLTSGRKGNCSFYYNLTPNKDWDRLNERRH
jgi:hypothetical protein